MSLFAQGKRRARKLRGDPVSPIQSFEMLSFVPGHVRVQEYHGLAGSPIENSFASRIASAVENAETNGGQRGWAAARRTDARFRGSHFFRNVVCLAGRYVMITRSEVGWRRARRRDSEGQSGGSGGESS